MRGAHQAFFLDDDEKSMRKAMSEILAAREAERAELEAKGEPALSRRTDPPAVEGGSGFGNASEAWCGTRTRQTRDR